MFESMSRTCFRQSQLLELIQCVTTVSVCTTTGQPIPWCRPVNGRMCSSRVAYYNTNNDTILLIKATFVKVNQDSHQLPSTVIIYRWATSHQLVFFRFIMSCGYSLKLGKLERTYIQHSIRTGMIQRYKFCMANKVFFFNFKGLNFFFNVSLYYKIKKLIFQALLP